MNKLQHSFSILLFCFPIYLGAQEDTPQVTLDSSAVSIHPFTNDLAQKYSGDAFEYDHTEEEAQNFLARAINWILDGMRDTFGVNISPEATEITRTIIYSILILLAIYLCLRVFMGREVASFFTKPSKNVAPITINEEQIDTVDFDTLIQNALAQKQYHVAIRYLYLKTLRELSANHHIEYHVDKTNANYIHEITDATLRQNFTRVSYIYEHACYGEFEVNDTQYTQLKPSFDHLFTLLKTDG